MKGKFVFLIILLYSTFSISFAQYKKVKNGNLDIHYRILGEGKPLLIIGGGPGDNSERYLELSELLSKNYQCILVDQRGTGKSMPEIIDSSTISIDLTLSDFETLRKSLSLEEWNILGFSYGGYLASLYAHFYPASVDKMILLGSMGLNTEVFGYFFDNVKSRMKISDLELLDYWSDSTRVAENPIRARVEQVRSIMSGYFYDKEKSLLVSQAINDSSFCFEMGQWIWKDIVDRNLDLSEMQQNYAGDILILHGRQDPLGELTAKNISDYYKNSRLVFIEKAGHYSWIEQPEFILQEVTQFLK